MRKRLFTVFVLSILAALRLSAQSNLEFIENKGQWDKSVKFKADIPTGAFFLHQHGFTVLLQNQDDLKKARGLHGHNFRQQDLKNQPIANGVSKTAAGSNAAMTAGVRSHAYRVSFQNASDNTEIVADKPLATYNNYFLGNDPSKWASKCRIYQGITYKNIYPNIDARYYTDKGGLKYDLIVHPGGDPEKIIMKYEGAEKLSIRNNELLIKTSVSTAKELTPQSYQLNDKGRKAIECEYFMANDHTIRFKIKNYSPDATLVIDPTLVFSSFTGSQADNWGFTATYGPDGSAYAGGIAHGLGFPVTPGAFQTDFKGDNWDVALIKLSSDGSTRVYGTYLGGDQNEYPHSLVVDQQGNLVVFGRTNSTIGSFPATSVGPCGGRDIFVTKFNSTGTSLIGSLRIGGSLDDGVNIGDQDEVDPGNLGVSSLVRNYGDWSRGEVILDPAGNIFVASCSQSPLDFPIIGSVFQPTFGGGGPQTGVTQDAVIIKINPTCTSVIFSSFLGGSDDDVAYAMDINPITGDLYVGGSTKSTNMPGTSAAVHQPSTAGDIDGYISVITANGSTLKYTTYLGCPGIDMLYGVKFDKFGFPYVMGTTTGTWPIVNGPAGAGLYKNAGAKQYITKLTPDLSSVVYSTTFGSANAQKPNISPVAFLVDRCENVYVSGWGAFYTVNDPYDLSGTNGMPVTPDALKKITDNHDFYFTVIKRDATGLLYGSFFGQTDNFLPSGNDISEHVDGGTSRYDKNGVIYQAICANCYEGGQIAFPTTPGVWAPQNGTGPNGCNLAIVKIAFNFAGVGASPQALINGVPDSSGCVPLTVNIQDLVRNAKSYIWNYGDGSPDTATTSYQVTHTYNAIGEYLVTLIAIDSTTCNIRDTAYIHIVARNDRALLGFNALKLPPCESLSYQFTNFSTPPAGKPFKDSSFIWDFGDGTTIVSGPSSITHFYGTAGTYKVRLLLVDTNYCNFPDSVVQTLSVAALVKAQFVTPLSGCAPYSAQFNNTSEGGQHFFWNFGDGGTSTDPSPTHLYPDPGTFTISLVVIDSNTCNIIDSTSTSITVSSKPHAAFTDTPIPPIVNTPTIFTNGATGGISYKWVFGDGDTAIRTTLDTVIHQYQSNGPFNACLIVFNQFGCTDTACNQVNVIINPLLDVPNAFTPGRFGENSVVKVRGFGISKLIFRIYNRWGQLVFESNDPNLGWNGTFKGTVQPMDVYAYIVEAVFFDGTRASKKGDITLLK